MLCHKSCLTAFGYDGYTYMDEQEFLRFVSRIIACGNEESVRLALTQLEEIVVRDNFPLRLLDVLEGLIETSREAAMLGNEKQKTRGKGEPRYTGVELSMEELGKVIRQGRERIRREREFRC